MSCFYMRIILVGTINQKKTNTTKNKRHKRLISVSLFAQVGAANLATIHSLFIFFYHRSASTLRVILTELVLSPLL
jgi:hypothetical protein